MRLAEKEHKKTKKSISTTTRNKTLKEEKVPEWFDKEIKKETATEEEEMEMTNLLSKYK